MQLYKEIEKSFPKIEKLFSEEILSEFSQTLLGNLAQYNFGLGTMIRLKLLRPERVLYNHFIQNGFTDKEEMSMEIIREFYKFVHRKI